MASQTAATERTTTTRGRATTARTTTRAAGSTARDRQAAQGRRRHVSAPGSPDRIHPRRGLAPVPHGLVDREHVREAAGQGERRYTAHLHRPLRRPRGVDHARRDATAGARARAGPDGFSGRRSTVTARRSGGCSIRADGRAPRRAAAPATRVGRRCTVCRPSRSSSPPPAAARNDCGLRAYRSDDPRARPRGCASRHARRARTRTRRGDRRGTAGAPRRSRRRGQQDPRGRTDIERRR